MNHLKTIRSLTLFILTIPLKTWSSTPGPDDLTLTPPPPCKITTQKRPRLPPKYKWDYMKALHDDFNGDGWCDYVLEVAYPINSKMNSFSIDDLMLLGGKNGWSAPLHGIKSWVFRGRQPHPNAFHYATFQVDMSNIKFIQRKKGGAPYVMGLFDGDGEAINNDNEPRRMKPIICMNGKYAIFFTGWMTVFRWDDYAGTFKEILGEERQAVLDFEFNQALAACPREP